MLISSVYSIRSIIEDTEQKSTYHVQAAEIFHFQAKYKYVALQDYPPIEAANWAIDHTNNTAVKKRLQDRIIQLTGGLLNQLAGYDVDNLFVEHYLVIARHPNGFEILQDAYTDANPQDNPAGTDVIEWQGSTFTRQKPDFTKWEEYLIYHTSIEELGRALLSDYSK